MHLAAKIMIRNQQCFLAISVIEHMQDEWGAPEISTDTDCIDLEWRDSRGMISVSIDYDEGSQIVYAWRAVDGRNGCGTTRGVHELVKEVEQFSGVVRDIKLTNPPPQ